MSSVSVSWRSKESKHQAKAKSVVAPDHTSTPTRAGLLPPSPSLRLSFHVASLERNELGVLAHHPRAAVLDRFVGNRKLSQVVSDHLLRRHKLRLTRIRPRTSHDVWASCWLDLHVDVLLAVVNANHAPLVHSSLPRARVPRLPRVNGVKGPIISGLGFSGCGKAVPAPHTQHCLKRIQVAR